MRALIVGAGCCGAAAARRLAEYGWQVTVVERRSHVGGNTYDRRNRNGVLYHVYGPHVFFTDRERVWNFLSPFARWVPFRSSLRVWIQGESYPMPFQPETLRRLLPDKGDLAVEAMRRLWRGRTHVTVFDLLNAPDLLLRQAGQRLYDWDCAPYNQKQWGLRPEDLLPEVVARAPVYLEDRQDFRPERFQFMPEDGFDALFRAVLNHSAVQVLTDTDASEWMYISGGRICWKTGREWDAVLYTGPLDRLLDSRAGALPYRTLHFDCCGETLQEGLPCLAMYYPESEFPWTRQTDYRYLPGNSPTADRTLVIGERPGPMEHPEDEPYYVVLTEHSRQIHQQYQNALAQVPRLYTAGRLADFRYYNMDEAVERGLDIAEAIHRRERGSI